MPIFIEHISAVRAESLGQAPVEERAFRRLHADADGIRCNRDGRIGRTHVDALGAREHFVVDHGRGAPVGVARLGLGELFRKRIDFERRKELLRRNGKRRVEHRFVLEVKAVVSNGRNFGRFDSKERVDARNRHIGARRFKAFGNSEAGVLFFVFGSCAFDFGADGFRRIRQRKHFGFDKESVAGRVPDEDGLLKAQRRIRGRADGEALFNGSAVGGRREGKVEGDPAFAVDRRIKPEGRTARDCRERRRFNVKAGCREPHPQRQRKACERNAELFSSRPRFFRQEGERCGTFPLPAARNRRRELHARRSRAVAAEADAASHGPVLAETLSAGFFVG